MAAERVCQWVGWWVSWRAGSKVVLKADHSVLQWVEH